MKTILGLLTFLCACVIPTYAYQPYHVLVQVGPVDANISAPNLVNLNNSLKTISLETLIPIYTPVSPVTFDVNLRGLIANTAFAANSTNLLVSIPNAGITTSFDGGTRDQSWILFKEFIKEGTSVPEILRAYARFSPIDPIAGNPNSLMARMAQADYTLGKLSPLSGCSCWSSQPIVHQFQTGIDAWRTFCENYDTTIITLPLRYSYSPDHRWAFIIDAPFIYNRNGGASSVLGSLGVGLRVPMTHRWSLTPILRLGTSGSLDLACSGSFISEGITSIYDYKIGPQVLTLTNYIGYFSTTNLWLTGVNFNYHLHNVIFKNGLSYTSCNGIKFCNRLIHFKVSIEDSYFSGDRLFIQHFDEVAVALITTHINPRVNYDCISMGFAYQFGQNGYRGYSLNLIYQF